jgi:hypothetical protein
MVVTVALFFAAATTAYAAEEALTEEQIEGVQKAIKAMGCTVPDDEIEAEGDGYEADDVICDDGQYDVYLDKDFKVINKVKE